MTKVLSAAHKFIFSTGACQPPESFRLAEDALAKLGYESQTPDTHFNTPGTTFQTAGRTIADAVIKFTSLDDDSITIVGHSNGANPALWAAAELEQHANPELFKRTRVLLVNGGLDPSVSSALGRPYPKEVSPAKNTQQSRRAVIMAPGFKRNQYMTIFDKRVAASLLYHKAPRDIADRMVWALRPHYRPPAGLQPPLKEFPHVPIDSIVTLGDPVVNHRFQTYRDREWLEITSDLLMNADHSPHISTPDLFAAKLGEIAHRPPQPIRLGDAIAEQLF